MKKFKFSFFKSYVIPLVLIFLIPVSGYFYFDYAAKLEDNRVLNLIDENIKKSKSIPISRQSEFYEYFAENPPSSVCLNPSSQASGQLMTYYSKLCSSYQYFNIAKQTSYWTSLASLATILFAGLLFALSFRSQRMLYHCFKIAWHYAKIFSIAQVVIQGSLLSALSYIVPVQFTGHYVPKISLLVAISIIYAAFHMIRSLFLRFNSPMRLEGHLLRRENAEQIWSYLDVICENLGTNAPDNFILGVDDNFFVTEHPVTVDEDILTGRTLYASIFHMEKFSIDESRAVIAHEIAHFSGNDTLFSKKISPMLNRCDIYLNILSESLTTLPIFYFLLCFRSLFELSLCKISRQREARADKLAAELVGADHLVNALVKLVLYSNYRLSIEHGLYFSDKKLDDIKIFEKITAGFQDYLCHQENNLAFLEQETEHPFDTHPSISKRMEALGITASESMIEHAMQQPEHSWFESIEHGHSIKEKLITNYEKEFKHAHEHELSYRLMPQTNEEIALVEKHFPNIEVKSKDGKRTINIHYDEINSSEWLEPIKFSEIKSYEFQNNKVRSKRIQFVLHDKKKANKGRVSLNISKMDMPSDEIVERFYHYLGRDLYAKHAANTEAA